MDSRVKLFLLFVILLTAFALIMNGIMIVRRGGFTLPWSRHQQVEGNYARIAGIILIVAGSMGLLTLPCLLPLR
jgi:hypothetical protein